MLDANHCITFRPIFKGDVVRWLFMHIIIGWSGSIITIPAEPISKFILVVAAILIISVVLFIALALPLSLLTITPPTNTVAPPTIHTYIHIYIHTYIYCISGQSSTTSLTGLSRREGDSIIHYDLQKAWWEVRKTMNLKEFTRIMIQHWCNGQNHSWSMQLTLFT